MRFEDARELMAERSRAAVGAPSGKPVGWTDAPTDTETVVRALLSGLDVDDLDAVIEGLESASQNTLLTLALSGPDRVGGSLMAAFAQILLTGFLMARDS